MSAKNKASQSVAFCQTVLPGNEAMLIPTLVEELATLAVPGTSYWCETAAQYYINAPGVSVEEGCVWGTNAKPVGNWSPYTAGGNTVSDGSSFLKIGWNPIYLETTCPFRNTKPTFGIEVECEGGGCNGLPCKIDPSTMDVNEMSAEDVFTGAGDATGCVVTVPKGSKANVIVFDVDGSSSSGSSSSSSESSTSTVVPTSTSTSTSTSTPTPTPTSTSTSTTETPTPTSTSTSTPTPTSTSTSTVTPTSTSSSTSTSTVTPTSTVTSSRSSSTRLPKSSPSMSYTYRPHVFAPTGAAVISSSGSSSSSASSTSGAVSASATGTGAATSTAVSMMSVALGAVAAMFMNF